MHVLVAMEGGHVPGHEGGGGGGGDAFSGCRLSAMHPLSDRGTERSIMLVGI